MIKIDYIGMQNKKINLKWSFLNRKIFNKKKFSDEKIFIKAFFLK